MPFIDLRIRLVESSDFGPKSDDLAHRILKSDLIPSDFTKSDCSSRPIPFSDRKIKIRSLESDRIINGFHKATIFVMFATLQREHVVLGNSSRCVFPCVFITPYADTGISA